MAGDWIKMRANLHTHPKVVRMVSALQADRLRVIGGLHAVWCLFDEHSECGRLDGYTADALDDLIGFPGFARAMQSIGWLEEHEGSLVTPRFDEHNGQSAKRRAQETARKRVARKTSALPADKNRTREEKRREEINTPLPPSAKEAGVLDESWRAFTEMRQSIKKPMTDRAVQMMVKRLSGLAAQGWDPNDLLDASTRNSWQDVYPEKVEKRNGASRAVVL